jgi:hypothetical protein
MEDPVVNDFGLAKIAAYFGKSEALDTYYRGSILESEGNVDGAIKLYSKAYKMWPALDSVPTDGGLPRCVREEVDKVGYVCEGMIAAIDCTLARQSEVVLEKKMLGEDDLNLIDNILNEVQTRESSMENNYQNEGHHNKVCTFLSNPPHNSFQKTNLLDKILDFAQRAWDKGDYSGNEQKPGPLHALKGGVNSLNLRLVEHWEYSPGGGLVDPEHYDNNSVLTLVCLLSDSSTFEGGTFRTNESNGNMKEYAMNRGDAICFVSHKLHNVVPLVSGKRRSMVIELWEGGEGHQGRSD